MLTLFLEFGARTRPQDLWHLLISAAGLKFLIWSQGDNRVTGLMWRGPQKYTACNENDTYNKVKSEVIYHKDYLFPLRPD